MGSLHSTRLAVAMAILVAGAGAAGARAMTLAAQPAQITAAGVDGVKLGQSYRSLRAKALLGKVLPGCELAGPNTRMASLRAPLKGSVDLTTTSPRKVASIALTGGPASARGVGIGATSAEITAAFPQAKADHSTDSVFLLTVVRVPKGAGGKIEFGVDTKTKKVVVVGVPFLFFCD